MKFVFERVLETVKAHPNQDQQQIAELLGITSSHVSACIGHLERHDLVGHQLVKANSTGRRHRGYFTVDGTRLKHACTHCGAEMHLYGFTGDELVQKCSACKRVVVVR